MKFAFGGAKFERIEIEVLVYERDNFVGEYYDDNWVTGNATLQVGKFRGKYSASFLTEDFPPFLDQLVRVYESLTGQAEFFTLEGQLSLLVRGDGRGHINIQGEAIDSLGIGNRLKFKLEIDQTQLTRSIEDLKAIISRYPTRTA